MGKKHDAFIKRIEDVQKELEPAMEAYVDELPKQSRGIVADAANSLDSAFGIVRMLAEDDMADVSAREAAETAIRLVALSSAVSKLRNIIEEA